MVSPFGLLGDDELLYLLSVADLSTAYTLSRGVQIWQQLQQRLFDVRREEACAGYATARPPPFAVHGAAAWRLMTIARRLRRRLSLRVGWHGRTRTQSGTLLRPRRMV